MPFLVSPGVQVNEKDNTGVVPGVSTSTGAFAGHFQWGPVLKPTMITSEVELVSVFQKPVTSNAASFFSAANFLAYSSSLLVNRVDASGQLNSTSKGVGVKINNEDTYRAGVGTTFTAATHGVWGAKYPGSFGNSIRVSMADDLTFASWQYASSFDNAPSSGELHIVVVDADGRWSGTAGTLLEKFDYVSKAADAKKSDLTSAYYVDQVNNNSKYVWWISHPLNQSAAALNWGANLQTAPISSLTAAGLAASATQTLGAANAAIKPGQLITGTNIPLGTYVYSISGTTLVMSAAATGTTPGATTLTFGQFQTLAVSDTVTTASTAAGANAITISASLTTVVAGQSITGAGIPAGTTIISNTAGVLVISNPASLLISSGAAVKISNNTGTSTLAGGADDFTHVDADKIAAFAMFANAQEYDVGLLFVGKASATVAISVINNVAEVRKDCVVFVSPEKVSDASVILGSSLSATSDTVAYRNAVGVSSSYAFMDSGYKYQYDRYNDVYRYVPLNGDIAGLAARAEFTDDAWFSPAGLNRGQIKNVIKLAYNPGQTDRDTLYKSGVNPVVTFPGQGTVLYGDKTLLSKPSAFDRINVRRLFIVLEKSIANAAKYQLFEFNDAFTQAQFRNMVEPFLRDVQGRRGITAFRVVCDSTNNTQQIVDTNNFVGDIGVAPSRSINFINLNFIADRSTGAVQFTETGA